MFRRRALELAASLRTALGVDFPAELNPDKPRRGAFELTLVKSDGSGENKTARDTKRTSSRKFTCIHDCATEAILVKRGGGRLTMNCQ